MSKKLPAQRKKSKNLKWTDELANELHKPVIKHFRKRKVFANGIDEIWAADLVDMQAYSKYNNGIKYLLMVIDIFSKYGWIIPLKSKTGIEVADAFNKIFKDRKCMKLWVDKAEASNKKNENKVWFNLNGKIKSNPIQPKFSIGDKVRIIKKKGAFEKGYTPRWTEEVFTVSQVQYTDPPTYKITDYNGEEIQATSGNANTNTTVTTTTSHYSNGSSK
ncbi:uncharacterized protein LOC136086111 [Hydra vulgaris]|uniref:uncharacterized protein LOC136086111 n=1 Tax=Hydra vulgaris TaxID=6087 RepID=UPI0032EA45EF